MKKLLVTRCAAARVRPRGGGRAGAVRLVSPALHRKPAHAVAPAFRPRAMLRRAVGTATGVTIVPQVTSDTKRQPGRGNGRSGHGSGSSRLHLVRRNGDFVHRQACGSGLSGFRINVTAIFDRHGDVYGTLHAAQSASVTLRQAHAELKSRNASLATTTTYPYQPAPQAARRIVLGCRVSEPGGNSPTATQTQLRVVTRGQSFCSARGRTPSGPSSRRSIHLHASIPPRRARLWASWVRHRELPSVERQRERRAA